jgi:hypothetical protein
MPQPKPDTDTDKATMNAAIRAAAGYAPAKSDDEPSDTAQRLNDLEDRLAQLEEGR